MKKRFNPHKVFFSNKKDGMENLSEQEQQRLTGGHEAIDHTAYDWQDDWDEGDAPVQATDVDPDEEEMLVQSMGWGGGEDGWEEWEDEEDGDGGEDYGEDEDFEDEDGYDLGWLAHEYGHYLQQQEYGDAKYYTDVALPSLISASTDPENHDSQWYEVDATSRGQEYLDEYSVYP